MKKKYPWLAILASTILYLSGCDQLTSSFTHLTDQFLNGFTSHSSEVTSSIVSSSDESSLIVSSDDLVSSNDNVSSDSIVSSNAISSESIVSSNTISSENSVSSVSSINSSVSSEQVVSLDPSVEAFQELLLTTRDEARKSNILIFVDYYDRFGSFITKLGSSSGSGVVFELNDNNYYAISNAHVFSSNVADQIMITVETMSGFEVKAELIEIDTEIDLALIRFSSSLIDDVKLMDIHARETDFLDEGEFVLAVGNPAAIEGNVTYGEFINMERIQNVTYPVIHHSALIYSGNSGGALVDIYGNLVGINTWGSEDSPTNSYSIPLTVVLEFLSTVEGGVVL